jgi:hypothetical protein
VQKLGVKINLFFKYEESPLNDVIGGMGGLNFTPT